MMTRHLSSPALLAVACGVLAAGACRDAGSRNAAPETQGLEGFFNPQPGEVWTYAVTRDFAPGSKLRPAEEARATELVNGAKRVTFERRRLCAGLERPEGAEKDLTAFELHEDGLLVEREFYDITPAGLIGRGWTPAPEITPAIKPPPKGILLNPGVTIALPGMLGGQSWTAPGVSSGALFQLDVIERATISVPAGEFQTARIRLTTSGPKRNTKRTVWFAENIGIVKEEVVHYGPESILVKEELVLTKWSLPSSNSAEPTPAAGPPSGDTTPVAGTGPALPVFEGYGPPISPVPDPEGSGEGNGPDEPGGTPGEDPDEPGGGTPDEANPDPAAGDNPDPAPEDNDPAPPRAEIVEE